MRVAWSSLMNALTGLVSRNAKATNIDVTVAAPFVNPNRSLPFARRNGLRRGVARRRKLTVLTRGRYSSAVTQRSCADDLRMLWIWQRSAEEHIIRA